MAVAAGCSSLPTPPRGALAQDQPSATAAVTLESLAWLAGTWATDAPDGPHTEEHWLAPAGGTMVGVSRTVADGRTVFFEFLRIVADDEGIGYLASPLGRDPPTRFAVQSAGPNTVTFINPGHDFPQRIEYRRDGDRLYARVGDHDGDRPKESTWSMRRVAIP